MSKIFRRFSEPIRENLTWEETWQQEDRGLIKNYEVGKMLALKQPELAEKAKRGELPALGYMGGTDIPLVNPKKLGSLNYLAQWQALRGEDLDIDTDDELVLVCSKTNVEVFFTWDMDKLKHPY